MPSSNPTQKAIACAHAFMILTHNIDIYLGVFPEEKPKLIYNCEQGSHLVNTPAYNKSRNTRSAHQNLELAAQAPALDLFKAFFHSLLEHPFFGPLLSKNTKRELNMTFTKGFTSFSFGNLNECSLSFPEQSHQAIEDAILSLLDSPKPPTAHVLFTNQDDRELLVGGGFFAPDTIHTIAPFLRSSPQDNNALTFWTPVKTLEETKQKHALLYLETSYVNVRFDMRPNGPDKNAFWQVETLYKQPDHAGRKRFFLSIEQD